MTINDFNAKMTRNSNESSLLKTLQKLARIEDPVNTLKFDNDQWKPWTVEMISVAPEPCATA